MYMPCTYQSPGPTQTIKSEALKVGSRHLYCFWSSPGDQLILRTSQGPEPLTLNIRLRWRRDERGREVKSGWSLASILQLAQCVLILKCSHRCGGLSPKVYRDSWKMRSKGVTGSEVYFGMMNQAGVQDQGGHFDPVLLTLLFRTWRHFDSATHPDSISLFPEINTSH